MERKKRFGLNLTIARNKKNISAYELSLRLGKDKTYIGKIENGKNYPSLSVVYEIMEILDVEPNELLK
ncbi:MAG: helix-turn-helix domain-containing protein [Christensenellales bacterium]